MSHPWSQMRENLFQIFADFRVTSTRIINKDVVNRVVVELANQILVHW